MTYYGGFLGGVSDVVVGLGVVDVVVGTAVIALGVVVGCVITGCPGTIIGVL
jgi:hypothetical protein